MSEKIFDRVSRFFKDLSISSKAQKELRRYDQIIQFNITDEGLFFIRISNGEAIAERGEIEKFDFLNVLLIKTDTNTINALLEKDLTLGEALFQGKIDIYGNIVKEYIIAWLSQLLRIKKD